MKLYIFDRSTGVVGLEHRWWFNFRKSLDPMAWPNEVLKKDIAELGKNIDDLNKYTLNDLKFITKWVLSNESKNDFPKNPVPPKIRSFKYITTFFSLARCYY